MNRKEPIYSVRSTSGLTTREAEAMPPSRRAWAKKAPTTGAPARRTERLVGSPRTRSGSVRFSLRAAALPGWVRRQDGD